ncbi:MAG: hypothetical protein NTY63_08830 [Candidatus Bipolaricaulota bacterium]|nr:hypothetical protein [Candidatus Bipolaricaulota bacterium]
MKRLAVLALATAVGVLAGCELPGTTPTDALYLITDEIPYAPVSPVGAEFFSRTVSVNYHGTIAVLSSSADGSGEIMVDDVMRLDIRHPDGTTLSRVIDFTNGCTEYVSPRAPEDISAWLDRGWNQITFTFNDQCGGMAGSTSIFLVIQ